jgi:hypothetical protein
MPIAASTRKILEELAQEARPEDFSELESGRLERLQLAARLILKGHQVRTALSLVGKGLSYPSWARAMAAYRDRGIDGVKYSYDNCGRKGVLSSDEVRLAVAHLALAAARAEIARRGGFLLPEADSPKARAAAKRFLRLGKLAATPEDEIFQLITQGLLSTKAWQLPPDLRPIAREIQVLAARAIFPCDEEEAE